MMSFPVMSTSSDHVSIRHRQHCLSVVVPAVCVFVCARVSTRACVCVCVAVPQTTALPLQESIGTTIIPASSPWKPALSAAAIGSVSEPACLRLGSRRQPSHPHSPSLSYGYTQTRTGFFSRAFFLSRSSWM